MNKSEIFKEIPNIFENIKFEKYLNVPSGHTLKALVLSVLKNDKGEYLILKRAEENDKDQWDLAGGSIESDDLDFEISKEVREETGNDIKNLKFEFSYD